jgi:hypothetical protein
MGNKFCSRCSTIKNADNDFFQNKAMPDGLNYLCKKCICDSNRERYYLEKDKICVSKKFLETLQCELNKRFVLIGFLGRLEAARMYWQCERKPFFIW